jgi:hypothetical protein
VVRDSASVGWRIRRLVQSILGILRMKGKEEMGDEEDEGEGGDEQRTIEEREMGTHKRR